MDHKQQTGGCRAVAWLLFGNGMGTQNASGGRSGLKGIKLADPVPTEFFYTDGV